jgi:hypothetical protein
MNIEMDKGENQELLVLVSRLKNENSLLKKENEQLKKRVKDLEEKLNNKQNSLLNSNINSKLKETLPTETPIYEDLTLAEYTHYGRQLILSDFGKSGILLVYLFIYLL